MFTRFLPMNIENLPKFDSKYVNNKTNVKMVGVSEDNNHVLSCVDFDVFERNFPDNQNYPYDVEYSMWNEIKRQFNSLLMFYDSGKIAPVTMIRLSYFLNSAKNFIDFVKSVIRQNEISLADFRVCLSKNQTNNEQFISFVSNSRIETGLCEIRKVFDKVGNLVSAERICRDFGSDIITEYFSDSDRVFYTKYGCFDPDINFQYELINNSQGELKSIIAKKPSMVLSGVFDIEQYFLSDYPQDVDIVNLIQKGKIPGIKLAKSWIDKNGAIRYEEKIPSNGYLIERHYFKKDNNYDYSYSISDIASKKPILKMDRSFETINKYTTKTKLNELEFVCEFDDENRAVEISIGQNLRKKIEFKSIIYMDKTLWNTIKKLPADLIIAIAENVQIWEKGTDSNSFFNDSVGYLKSSNRLSTIAHELGHVVDLYENMLKPISKNKNVIKIYEKEYEAFEAKYPKYAGGKL